MNKNNNLELLEYVKKLEKKIEIENEIKKLKKEKKKEYNILYYKQRKKLYCDTCKRKMDYNWWDKHIKTEKHLKKILLFNQ